MWIVRLALRRPYTFVVMALLIAITGGLSIATMPVDIFPYIDLPVVSIVWQYNGLTPEEMESRIVTNFERSVTANVVGVEHVESQSHQSVAVVRVFFHPTVSVHPERSGPGSGARSSRKSRSCTTAAANAGRRHGAAGERSSVIEPGPSAFR